MTASVRWVMHVDWADSGEPDDTFGNEADYAFDFQSERGRDTWLRKSASGQAVGFGRVKIGKAIIKLVNKDKRYDPYNASSDIITGGGTIAPGHKVEIYVTLATPMPSGQVDFPVFYGRIRNISPTSGGPDMESVQIEVEEILADLQGDAPEVPLSTNVLYSDAIIALLTDANWTVWAGKVDLIDPTSHSLSFWYSSEDTYLNIINALADATLGTFWARADGTARFADYERVLPTPTTWNAGDLLKEVVLDSPWESNKVDKITITGYAPPIGPETVLWTASEVLLIDNLQTLDIWTGRFKNDGQSCIASPLVTPANSIDIIINSEADSSGTDYTGVWPSVPVSYGIKAFFQVEFDEPGGAPPAYITHLQIRGTPMDDGNEITYKWGTGKNSFELNTKWIQQWMTCVDYVTYLVPLFATPRKMPIVQMENQPNKQFTVDLFDPIKLHDVLLTGDVYGLIGKIVHRWLGPTGEGTLTKFYLEEYTP